MKFEEEVKNAILKAIKRKSEEIGVGFELKFSGDEAQIMIETSKSSLELNVFTDYVENEIFSKSNTKEIKYEYM